MDDPADTALVLDDAHRQRRLLRAADVPVGDLARAYRVQDALTARRLARGDAVVGWKLGYTSRAMREQMGVDEPNLGPLLASMMLPDGVLRTGVTQPRVEPEVALVMAGDPGPGADVGAVLAATHEARAALEVVDSVWESYAFDLEHNTADGSSAAFVALGDVLPLDRVADLRVDLVVDGEVRATGHGRDASGHPAAGVAWLVERLAERGTALRPGDVVITGGLTPAVPLDPGAAAGVVFSWGGAEVGRAGLVRAVDPAS